VDVSTLPAFAAAALVITLVPGPAVALILRRAALRGFRQTVPVVLGLELGLFVWALLAGAGLAALIATSQTAYTVLRVVGAAVLLLLGGRALHGVWRSRAGQPDPVTNAVSAPVTDAVSDPVPGRGRAWLGFAEGLVVQLANPKAAILVFAFYPPFIPADAPQLATAALLGGVQVGLETGLYLGLAFGVGLARTFFSRPKVRQRLEVAGGTVLVGLGLRVAVDSR
jgi:threonine/homoserine/homoserine lactone efflux protein